MENGLDMASCQLKRKRITIVEIDKVPPLFARTREQSNSCEDRLGVRVIQAVQFEQTDRLVVTVSIPYLLGRYAARYQQTTLMCNFAHRFEELPVVFVPDLAGAISVKD